jgi:uncharacterized protein (DUF58 family)
MPIARPSLARKCELPSGRNATGTPLRYTRHLLATLPPMIFPSVPLFDTQFLTRLEYLSLVSRKVFQGELMAQRRTTQTGSGVEFADHRQYATGDDFRYLDWNLYARHGELLLKRFQEEEDLHVYILLDCSRSMSVSDSVRFDLARQLTAALAYVAMSDLDRVAVFAFADGVLDHFPLTRGKERILSLMEWLDNLQVSGETTSLKNLTNQFVQRGHRKGLAILISDFYDPQGFRPGLDLLRHHGYEPSVIQLHSPEEANPKLLGDVELADVETGEVRKLTVTENSLQRYRDRFNQFLGELTSYCTSYGIDCTISNSSVAFDDLLLAMMRSTDRPAPTR